MKTWEIINKKCPDCGADLRVHLLYSESDMCNVRYYCSICGWWIYMEKYPLNKVVVEGEE